MDFGFILLAIVITVPFWLLVLANKNKKKQAYQQELQKILLRTGIQTIETSKANSELFDMSDKSWFIWLSTKFKQAGIQEKKQVTQLVIGQFFLTFVSLSVLALKFNELTDTIILIAVLLPILIPAFVYIQLQKRQASLRQDFPNMLDSVVRSLQSGYSIDGAIGAVAEDMSGALAKEMSVINKQLSVGISMRDILREFQRRVDIPEAHFFVVTLIIQRETGGQLAAILSELSKLMRRRERFQAKLKTLTAESRFTAWFIGGAPVVYILYKYFFDKESMQFFLHDPMGIKMFAFSVVMIVLGAVILRQMLKMRF